jgi:hypothetical protein
MKITSTIALLLILMITVAQAQEENCCITQSGPLGVDFPVESCSYHDYWGPFQIDNGFPPGTQINCDGSLNIIDIVDRWPGGELGGEVIQFIGRFEWIMSGIGDLEGFQRFINIDVSCEVHTEQRDPMAQFQVFESDLMQLNGMIIGDPDFAFLNVMAGLNNDLPSPGQTEIGQLPSGDFAVDSFFDITYRIEFQGAPGSALEGYGGATMNGLRLGSCELWPEEPCCSAPDNGFGTVTIPSEDCDYFSDDVPFEIYDGLPPDSYIYLDGPLTNISVINSFPGGSLGGEIVVFTGDLEINLSADGDLSGFNRYLVLPVDGILHTAPRIPGEQVQNFQTDLYSLEMELIGDPDFDYLQIRAGANFGEPSPGSTTLIELANGNFAVDSFFDISYNIEFAGAPGSVLDGSGGYNMGNLRMGTCEQREASAAPELTISLGEQRDVTAVILQWNPVPGALYYNVLSSPQAYMPFPGTWNLEAQQTGTGWLEPLQPPMKFYRVVVIN